MLQAALNLFLDKINIQHRLTHHLHKVICLEIQDLGSHYFKIESTGIKAVSQHDADVVLRTRLIHLIKIMSGTAPMGLMDISGDIDLARDLFLLFQSEKDTFLFSKAFNWVSQSFTKAGEDFRYFLQDEVALAMSTQDAEPFYQTVESLRDDVARFEARLHILEQKVVR